MKGTMNLTQCLSNLRAVIKGCLILRYIHVYFDIKPACWPHNSNLIPWLFFVYPHHLQKLVTALKLFTQRNCRQVMTPVANCILQTCKEYDIQSIIIPAPLKGHIQFLPVLAMVWCSARVLFAHMSWGSDVLGRQTCCSHCQIQNKGQKITLVLT